MPRDVIENRKQGFVEPMTRWLQTDLKSYVLDVLSEENLNKYGLFNEKFVKILLNEHFDRIEIHDKLIWSFVIFQTWYNMYIKGDFPAVSLSEVAPL